uniref:Intraflagellar transport 74 n=1 Tax=Salarias fasciatus TaxID=181472 RepID=A0A672GBY2_SALFA
MASQRPPSGLGRPMSRSGAGRPPTAVRPPPTAIRVATGMVPGTGGHPAMRAGVPAPGVLAAPIKVPERPVTQQGLSGMKTGVKGPQRQILDKSYYLGLLSRMTELSSETSRLLKEMDGFNQENSVYLSYEKRAGGLAAEIRELQGQLGDYNMLVDKLNTSTEMEEMVDDFNTLKAHNDSEAEGIDAVFTQRRQREDAVRAVEDDIAAEKRVTEEAVQALPSVQRDKYCSLTAANEELLQELSVLQEDLDLLATRKKDYEADLAHQYHKQEVARLHENLSALEARRDALEAEQRSQRSPEEERETLFQQVRPAPLTSWSRADSEIRDRTRQIGEEIRHVEQDSEVAQGECQQKYKELKRREEEIDRFQDSFQETRAAEQQKLWESQENVVSLLETSSRSMLRLRLMDRVTASELRNMQEVLVSKESEVVRSESTAKGLSAESRRLQQDLEKVQQLEGKISGELNSLKERVGAMEAELLTYRDLDALRLASEHKKQRLQEDRASLTRRRDAFEQLQDEMNRRYEALKAMLQDNETHAQLVNLERKWQHLEQNNFVMKEFIASKSQESDFASVAQRVERQVAEFNQLLIQALSS